MTDEDFRRLLRLVADANPTLTHSQRGLLRSALQPPCHYCKTALGTTRDHIVPKALGGPNNAWNIVPSCPACNLAKGASRPTCTCDRCREAVARTTPAPLGSAPKAAAPTPEGVREHGRIITDPPGGTRRYQEVTITGADGSRWTVFEELTS